MIDRVYEALLAGMTADQAQEEIARLRREERELLLCMLSGIRNELASNCMERAHEVDRLLAMNGYDAPIEPSEEDGCCLCGICRMQTHCSRVKAGRVKLVRIGAEAHTAARN